MSKDKNESQGQIDEIMTYLRDSVNFDEALDRVVREIGDTGRTTYRISYDETTTKIKIEPVNIKEIYE